MDRARSVGDALAGRVCGTGVRPTRAPADLASFLIKPEQRRQPPDFFALLKLLRGLKGEVSERVRDGDAGTEPWFRIYPQGQLRGP